MYQTCYNKAFKTKNILFIRLMFIKVLNPMEKLKCIREKDLEPLKKTKGKEVENHCGKRKIRQENVFYHSCT